MPYSAKLVLERLTGVLAAPIRVMHQSRRRFPRNHAIVSASITMSAVMRGFIDQPTTSRLNRSSTIARYSQPSSVHR